MTDTGNAKDCLKISTHNFFDIYIKKRDLTNLFDWFHRTVLFSISFCLYRACYTHLISSTLSCNLKKLMQTYTFKVSGTILNVSTVHLNGI